MLYHRAIACIQTGQIVHDKSPLLNDQIHNATHSVSNKIHGMTETSWITLQFSNRMHSSLYQERITFWFRLYADVLEDSKDRSFPQCWGELMQFPKLTWSWVVIFYSVNVFNGKSLTGLRPSLVAWKFVCGVHWVRCGSVVECLLVVRWVVRSIPHMHVFVYVSV